jgi:membrane complex biogenesis BtpA family protein
MRTAIAVTLTAASVCAAGTKFENVFPMPKPVIAVINLPSLPGQKGFISMDYALKHAMDQLKILEEEGVEAILFENVDGDFAATPEMISAMTRIVSEAVKQAPKMIIGVEVLWHDPKASLAIATASGAKFVRTDFFADKMKAGDRIVDVNTKELIDYQKKIGAEDVLLLTDIQVKYAKMIDTKKTIRQSALDAKNKGSIGAIVDGPKSGVPPSIEKVKEAKMADPTFPVILGSGTNPDNIKELLSVADAAIVGTAISTKTGGVVIREKVQNYMKSVRELRASLNQPTVH